MPANENKKVINRLIEAFISLDMDHVDAVCDEFYSDDYKGHNLSSGVETEGLAAFKQNTRQTLTKNSEIKATLEDLIAEGDKVACRFWETGRSRSTGELWKVKAISILRIAGSKIAEEWNIFEPFENPD